MKASKIFLCAALMLALSAAIQLFPEQTDRLRQEALELLGPMDRYVETVQAMGRQLAEGGLGRELVAALKMGQENESAQAAAPASPEPFPAGYETALKIAAEELRPTAAELRAQAGELPEAVSAFLELQESYEAQGYPLPENVRTDMPELPFAYTQPVNGGESSGFGYRTHPIQGKVKFHFGTDFAAAEGEAVLAFAGGCVYAAGTSPGYGNYLILTHEGGFASVYAHLSAFEAREGDMVSRGQTIGRVGHTGQATGPHLHFELLLNDVYLNPEYYL